MEAPLAAAPVDAPVDALAVALLPPPELQAVAVVASMTAAAAPMTYLLLRMLFLVSSPGHRPGKGLLPGDGRS
jgi:hypothetical protein